MLKDNLARLRSINGFSQEEIAERIGITRQAYSKWESGVTIPDIEKCSRIADIYGVSIDSLISTNRAEGVGIIPPAPRDKNIWGSVTINDRGQIVIPKEARDKYGLTGGTRLIVLGDEEGIALIPAKSFEEKIRMIMKCASHQADAD